MGRTISKCKSKLGKDDCQLRTPRGGEAVLDSPPPGLEQIYPTTSQMSQYLQRDLTKPPASGPDNLGQTASKAKIPSHPSYLHHTRRPMKIVRFCALPPTDAHRLGTAALKRRREATLIPAQATRLF